MNYEEQVRREMERAAAEQQCPVDEDIDAAFNLNLYPRSKGLRMFAKDSSRLRKLGVKMRPKAGQRNKL